MHRRRSAVALVTGTLVLSATGILAGCGGQTGTEEAASTGSAASSAPAPASTGSTDTPAASTSSAVAGSGSSAQPFPADASVDTAEPVDPAGLTVTDVRTGAHDGFDRVVLDIAGQGTPGWTVEYVDSATSEGKGDPVGLAGPAYLRVVLTGVSNPYEAVADERARGAVAAPGGGVVTGAWFDGTFEGQSLAYVGTTAERPFRVYALSAPTRVVVEVAAG